MYVPGIHHNGGDEKNEGYHIVYNHWLGTVLTVQRTADRQPVTCIVSFEKKKKKLPSGHKTHHHG